MSIENIETARFELSRFDFTTDDQKSVCEAQVYSEQLWFEWAADIRGLRIVGRSAAIRFIREKFAGARREFLFAIYLNSDQEICDISSLGRGSIDSVKIRPAEVIQRGFQVGAAFFLLIHNHPSGDPNPSPTDIRFTARLARISADLDMPLVDHLVIATEGIRSVGQF